MTTIKISAEKIQHILSELKHAKEEVVDLRPQLPTLIAILESLLMLFDLLSMGGKIAHVQKLFGVANKQGERGDNSSKDREKNKNKVSHDLGLDNPNQPGPQDSGDSAGEASSEDNASSHEQDSKDSSAEAKKPNPNHKGKAAFNDYPEAPICEHHHEHLKPGDTCPQCGQGKLYVAIRKRILFTGHAPITPVRHLFRDLICNVCKAYFSASPSKEAESDGLGKEDRYGYSAISMIVLMKFFIMLPYYRLSRLSRIMGISIPSSSQYDQIEKLANILRPIFLCMQKNASQAKLFMADDATGKIIGKKFAFLKRRGTNTIELREGCHSSIAIAFDGADRPTILIKTDIIHAGEWLDLILKGRDPKLQKPIVMWDRCSSNTITVTPYIDIACNQHARQNFKDLEAQMPAVIRPILDAYKKIFTIDSQTREMTNTRRLKYHQTHSKPHFDFIVQSCKTALEKRLVTENSELGKAFQYVLNHEPALRGFLVHEGAPVSNNLTERVILYLVLIRRASHFYRTPASAAVADTILSVGLSAFLMGVNLHEYFRLILQHQKEVTKNPEQWLPWVFLERFPQYEMKYKSRARVGMPEPELPYIPLSPPK